MFVSELGEVTQLFKDLEVSQAIEKALDGGDVINVYTRSNFGNAFHHFWRNYLSAIDNKTTVLVLGDARNNYNDPRAWCLRDVHNKAKNVVWLNPESPSAWGFGDSVMDKYLPLVDVAEECRNLRQLSRIVDKLVSEGDGLASLGVRAASWRTKLVARSEARRPAGLSRGGASFKAEGGG